MTTPEQGIGQPEKSLRPTHGDILDKLDLYKRAENDKKGGGQYMIEEAREYLAGQGEPEVRERFYPGWEKEDFEKFLKLIEQETE